MSALRAIPAEPDVPGVAPHTALPETQSRGVITAALAHQLADVEPIWRALQPANVESPGQSFDFIRQWVESRGIARDAQHYVIGLIDDLPIALLPLHRKRVRGVRVFTWFPGANVGCYAPIADYERLAAFDPATRRQLWTTMLAQLSGADLVYLRSIPVEVGGHPGLFDELGSTLAVETLYRSSYGSWEECDRLQRSKSRRKHDRQQGDRLSALGEIDFEVIRNGDAAAPAIATMFKQRAARFKVMGVRDPFVHDHLTSFYFDAAKPQSGVDVRLHVLRLNGDIVAVRYNIVQGERMFCLISSMSDDPAIQHGSPGKQCLLRVMQSVFDDGFRIFDMGSGFTDEKRHWCNVQTPLRQHYIGVTPQGGLIATGHRAFQRARCTLKANKPLKSAVRSLQKLLDRATGATKPEAAADKSE